jgi:Listeria-Bacteroides repeat domain (List_Bact_rpt)
MGFTVTYDPNGATGGTVPDATGPYQAGEWVTVADNTGNLVEDGEVFANWNTAPDGTGQGCGGEGDAQIQVGLADLTLYAQWFTRAGLTPDQQGNAGRTEHYQFWYDSSLQKTAANPAGIEPDRTNALIEACEGDFAIMQKWFGSVELEAQRNVANQAVRSAKARVTAAVRLETCSRR